MNKVQVRYPQSACELGAGGRRYTRSSWRGVCRAQEYRCYNDDDETIVGLQRKLVDATEDRATGPTQKSVGLCLLDVDRVKRVVSQ